MINKGWAVPNPEVQIPKAIYKGYHIESRNVLLEDSQDVPVVGGEDNTQSEVSIFVHPGDNDRAFNSNNSTSWNGNNAVDLYGTSSFLTDDFGVNWTGTVEGSGGENSGDPATCIDLNGRHYVGYIHNSYGQGVSYSDDGVNWTAVGVETSGDWNVLDKNHLTVDNSPDSPYVGNVYDAWTPFGGSNDSKIVFSRSTDHGATYSTAIPISDGINASLSQGVNIQTGPQGEVYATWAVYNTNATTENAYGFTKSIDGGVTFSNPIRAIDNVYGIRDVGVSKNMRVTSFPSMAVDISNGANRGNIYIVFANKGVPGENSGSNLSVYLIKSTDGGDTWSTPVRVNQGPFQDGKEAYMPWIACDPENGTLSVIFYDDRNVSSTQVETWVAVSYDAGETWEDFRVSDVAFTPQPIAGLAEGYMGDYIGITARGGKVYPAWMDNRNGYVQTFISPFETNPREHPYNLQIALDDATGQTNLTWDFNSVNTFEHFIIYRDGVQIGTSTEQNFTDNLPDYGVYQYKVSAMHTDGESSTANGSIQWGDAHIQVTPESLTEYLAVGETSTRTLTMTNTGELPLEYSINSEFISTFSPAFAPMSYCEASGGYDDEYISGVQFLEINNTSGQDYYGDYTNMQAFVNAGETYPITITNGEIWDADDLGIWIDFNQDEDFDDEGENVLCLSNMGGQGTFDISIPNNALSGSTRMRIRIKYNGNDCGSPCGNTTYGEVEDYTVVVNNWLNWNPVTGTLAPGESQVIEVNFDATQLTVGEYNANLIFNNNDPDNASLIVPITLFVQEDTSLNVQATADSYEVCEGNETTLHANANGGTGNYTYSWTSNPAGFTSTESDPVVTPAENTTYTVEVSDGDTTTNSSVTITTTSLPDSIVTPFGETNLCQDSDNTTYNTDEFNGFTGFSWELVPSEAGEILGNNDTNIEINWNADFSGMATLTVTGSNACGSLTSDPLEITVNPAP
jgi:hypothetical protein